MVRPAQNDIQCGDVIVNVGSKVAQTRSEIRQAIGQAQMTIAQGTRFMALPVS